MFVVWATAAAVLSMTVALWAPRATSGLPLGRFPRRELLVYVGSIGAVSVSLTVVVSLFAGGGSGSAALAVTVSLVVTVALVLASIRALVPLRRVQVLSERLRTGVRPSEARTALLECVRRAGATERRGEASHAVLVLTAASAFADARLWHDARSLLDSLDPAALTPQLRANHAVGAATCMLYLGDREGARALLATVPTASATPSVRGAAEASHALLLALTGRAGEALRLLDAPERPAPSDLRLGRARDVARAHALQGLGDTEGARAVLEGLRAVHGTDALLRVQALNGPASALAAALLRGRETPYRG